MPRPIRIEYENAFYHVMNRGRGRQDIFHDEAYFRAFLETITEAHQRFGCVVHSYCLMSNHYHLLIETPNANLSRVMRHINGVYTQRYNRIKCTDGPLFRGRYKAVLVGQDDYLLQLSRYIHRNPIETTIPLVEKLEDYQWSSYPSFVGRTEPEEWLERKFIYQVLKHPNPFDDYRKFVMLGVDEETAKFHQKGRTGAIFGDEHFKQWVFDELMPQLKAERKSREIQPNLTIEQVVIGIASFYQTSTDLLLKCTRGPQVDNEPRKVAMYLCQELSAARLVEIADYFNLSHYGSVGFATNQVRKRKMSDAEFSNKLDLLIKSML